MAVVLPFYVLLIRPGKTIFRQFYRRRNGISNWVRLRISAPYNMHSGGTAGRARSLFKNVRCGCRFGPYWKVLGEIFRKERKIYSETLHCLVVRVRIFWKGDISNGNPKNIDSYLIWILYGCSDLFRVFSNYYLLHTLFFSEKYLCYIVLRFSDTFQADTDT